MSDRKYRQRGYMDEPRAGEPREKSAPKPQEPRAPGRQLQSEKGPKTPNLMSSHEVFRCSRCGNLLALRNHRAGLPVQALEDLVDRSVAPKDEKNTCAYFAPRTTVERQTSTPAQQSPATNSAKKAFDDLFNF